MGELESDLELLAFGRLKVSLSRMLSSRVLQGLRVCTKVLQQQGARNFGVTAAVQQKAEAQDPIQQLFLEKIREYAMKSTAAGGKLVDSTPEKEAELKAEMDKVDRMFGATGPDFLKFPTFDFKDSSLEEVQLGDMEIEDGNIFEFE